MATPTLTSPPSNPPPDGLFLERLEAFLDRSLNDMKAFSEREGRPLEEMRQYVAEWHWRYLFRRIGASGTSEHSGEALLKDGRAHAHEILHVASQALEHLHTITGVHSILLAIDPSSSSTSGGILNGTGFLGGTVLGREFWRGFRGGGGEVGARAFKAFCAAKGSGGDGCGEEGARKRGTKKTPANAGELKAETYSAMRAALRSASGNRMAEMKWSNHTRLSIYNVRLVGWPDDIPHKNPSTLSVAENRRLLGALENGELQFVRNDEGRVMGSIGSGSRSDGGSGTRSWDGNELVHGRDISGGEAEMRLAPSSAFAALGGGDDEFAWLLEESGGPDTARDTSPQNCPSDRLR